ncbi:MAG: ABC transporter substrate-binding protein [Rubrivivax sp.]|nr:ABC transporter substrate-binding protein [Rubrivivax sp.]
MKTIRSLQAALPAALLVLGGAAQAQVSDNVVRIGFLADQSGPYASNGGPGSELAIRMAVEDFGGKVAGKAIEVVVADDQNKPDVGLTIARRWLDLEKVDVIVTGSASSIALGVANLAREYKKPFIAAGTATADLTGKACSPMNFQFVIDTYFMPKSSMQALLQQGVKTFFFVAVDYAYGAMLASESQRFVEAGGGKVVGSVKHPLGTTDFSSFLLQAQASKAQAIVLMSSGADLTNALKQAREYQIQQQGQIVTSTGMTINAVAAMGLDVAQGLRYVDPFYWDRDDESRAWSRRFMARHKGVAPNYLQAGAYSATLHYLKAVAAAGTDDGPAVVAKMKATRVNDFQMKNVAIREDGQVMRPGYVVQIKAPGDSKSPWDYYKVGSEIAAAQLWRPLAEGQCEFLKK